MFLLCSRFASLCFWAGRPPIGVLLQLLLLLLNERDAAKRRRQVLCDLSGGRAPPLTLLRFRLPFAVHFSMAHIPDPLPPQHSLFASIRFESVISHIISYVSLHRPTKHFTVTSRNSVGVMLSSVAARRTEDRPFE